MPRYSSVKPDFQAPGPRMLINNIIQLSEGQLPEDISDDEEMEEMTGMSQQRIR